tara:strand:+ start:475 stop:711 length:237 start_codon:yes stop_codon:yes gene_type:complete
VSDKEIKINQKLVKIFKKIFKEDKIFFSMENTLNWDSLNHLRLISDIQKKFKIRISNIEISKLTDQKKISKLLLKKIN